MMALGERTSCMRQVAGPKGPILPNWLQAEEELRSRPYERPRMSPSRRYLRAIQR